ncbi:MAG: helix-turn-helix domain-containing protein, partial [Lachnospira sp.]|nr:helix-turn-helix domain-containing protein [Lachnospira sp.]
MSITAKELAKQLGLSPSAVSIALNNKPGISTETRKRVLEAAKISNYDFSKLSEKKTSTGIIYFLIYIKDGTVVYDNPF